MTFEHRHENKRCSSCPKDHFDAFKVFKCSGFEVFQNIPASRLLSDFQKIFYKMSSEDATGTGNLKTLKT